MSSEETNLISYETDTGPVKLSPDIIRKYLVSGDPSKVSAQEVMMFLQLCRFSKLNPFLREAYLIKYGAGPATIVTGKEVFTKRAASAKNCAGWEAGVIVQNSATVEYRNGTFLVPGDKLIGGWAKVFRKDWSVPASATVGMDEYMRCTADGKPMASWKTMPATMIRKVALVHALREAFPEEFEGMYSPEEMAVDVGSLSEAEVKIDNEIETEANADVIDVDPEEEGEQASLDIPEEPKKSKPKF
jgi:phage recombination protein Bet